MFQSVWTWSSVPKQLCSAPAANYLHRKGRLLGCLTSSSIGLSAGAQMPNEPIKGEVGHLLERPRLLEEVRCSRDDLKLFLYAQPLHHLPVHLDYGNVVSSHDQERRSPNAGEGIPRKVRAPPARDDCADFLGVLGCRYQRGPAPVLAPKWPTRRFRVSGSPFSQSVAPTSCWASIPMSNRRWLVRRSISSSSGVSKSISSVASPLGGAPVRRSGFGGCAYRCRCRALTAPPLAHLRVR
jgi:hypothetical protein